MTRLEATKYSMPIAKICKTQWILGKVKYNTTARVLQYSFWLAGKAVGQWKVDQNIPNRMSSFNFTLCVCVCMTLQLLPPTLDLIPSDRQLSLILTIKCFFIKKLCLQNF